MGQEGIKAEVGQFPSSDDSAIDCLPVTQAYPVKMATGSPEEAKIEIRGRRSWDGLGGLPRFLEQFPAPLNRGLIQMFAKRGVQIKLNLFRSEIDRFCLTVVA